MGREWKPGDVAESEYRGVKSLAFVVEGLSCPSQHPRSPHWHGKAGGWNTLDDGEMTYRPLVVIDPEDREQVEDLCRRYVETYGGRWDGREKPVSDMQAAFRSLVAPPKLDEPTAYLAAVVDADGNRWHISEGPTDGDRRWYSPDLNTTRAYRDIVAVRVLSEGVSS